MKERKNASKVENKEDNFSNGRLARNVFEKLIMNHAKRVVEIAKPSKNQLVMITAEDCYNI